MSNEARHSQAHEAEIIIDPILIAKQEAANALRQYNQVTDMVLAFIDPERPFRFRPSHILTLHRVALHGLSGYAGNWRPARVEIYGSGHNPPDAYEVPSQIEALCDYVNENWRRSALHLASYVMWKLNWIHPFTDGNGRTSRAVSYLILCTRMGYLLPGRIAIPEQIVADKAPYYRALESADSAWSKNMIDVSEMENLLSGMLAAQLLSIHGDSKSGDE